MEGSKHGPGGLSATVSEAQLFERCSKAVEECRKAVEELRGHVKGARSHREKCANLLAAATTAVMNLEELLYSQDIDVAKEKQLQSLCTRVRSAIDQAETKVRVYGQMGGFTKLCAGIFADTNGKFETLVNELNSLAQQAHQVLQAPLQRPSSVGADALPAALSGQPSGAGAGAGGGRVAAVGADGEPGALPLIAHSSRSLDRQVSKRSFINESVPVPVPVEALQRQRLYRGSRGSAVSAMLYVAPEMDALQGRMGRMWFYVSKTFGGALFTYDLSSKVMDEVAAAKGDSTVTVLHRDAFNRLWTGHRKGYIRVWDEATRAPLCEPVSAFNSPVRTLTTDENGAVWAGSDKGNVKCVRLEDIELGGARLRQDLVVKGSLKWAGPGMPEVTSGGSSGGVEGSMGMIDNKHLKEPAHYGAVTATAAALGRVWTAGGSSAFVCLREWTQRGEFMASTDLRSVGTANTMIITSPIVRVLNSAERVPSATASVASSRMDGGACEMPQLWQLLTGHDSGLIQVWTLVAGMLKPILRIGDRMAPAKGIVVCEQMGAVCTAHIDGRLLIRTLPHPKSSSALTVTYAPNNVSAVKLPYAEIEASKTGLALAEGGMVGVITASNNGTITLWPEAVLRQAAQEKKLELQSEHSPPEQWPLLCYSSAALKYAISEAIAVPENYSVDAEYMDFTGEPSNPMLPGQSGGSLSVNVRKQPSAFEQSNTVADWRIEGPDLSFDKVIGEGAIGKVYLGRYQETDVAIKRLNSLGQLAMGMADDSAQQGGMSSEVMRTLDREVGILVKLRHPNVILFMGVCVEPPCVVTEFCQRGSLYDVLKTARSNPALCKQLDWGKRLNMALDAAKGMHHLHSHRPSPILHRDLKSPNLLVDKHWRVKVTDFNLSRITETAGPNVQSSLTANNPRWLAPEVIQTQKFSKASDVYAFGLIMWELMTWDIPFKDLSHFQIMIALTQQHARPDVPDQYTQLPGGTFPQHQQYVALMKRCWADNPEDRPGFDVIIAELRLMLEQYSNHINRPGAARTAGTLPSPVAPPRLGPPAQAQLPAPASSRQFEGGAQPTGVPAAAGARPGPSPFDSAAAVAPSSRPHDSVLSAGASAPRVPPMSPFDAPSGPAAVPTAAAPAPPISPFEAPSGVAAPPPSPFGGAAEAAPWLTSGAAAAVAVAAAAAVAGGQQREGGGSSPGAAPAEKLAIHEMSLNAMGAASGATSGAVSTTTATSSATFEAPGSPRRATATGESVLAANGPPPSPFGGFVAPSAAATGTATCAHCDAPLPTTVRAADGPPPSPFGGFTAAAGAAAAAAATPTTVRAADGPPPSPFGDSPFAPPAATAAAAAAAPTAVLAANGPPPSPFGDSPFVPPAAVAAPTAVRAADGPPPSPFGDSPIVPPAAVATPTTLRAADGPPPSPFGESPFVPPAAAAPVAVLAANGPPPSPFGGTPFVPPPVATGGATQLSSSSSQAVDMRNLDSVVDSGGLSPNSSQQQDSSASAPNSNLPLDSEAGPAEGAAAAAPAQQQHQQRRPLVRHATVGGPDEESEGQEEEGPAAVPAAARVYQRSTTAPSKFMTKLRGGSGRRSGK